MGGDIDGISKRRREENVVELSLPELLTRGPLVFNIKSSFNWSTLFYFETLFYNS